MLTSIFLFYLSFTSHFFGELNWVDFAALAAIALFDFSKFSLKIYHENLKDKNLKTFSFTSKKSN